MLSFLFDLFTGRLFLQQRCADYALKCSQLETRCEELEREAAANRGYRELVTGKAFGDDRQVQA